MGDSQIVLSSLGYFAVLATLLALSGLSGAEIQYPTEVGSDNGAGGPHDSFVQAVGDCIINIVSLTNAGSCNYYVKSQAIVTITNVLNWAVGAVTFLFQLATFQLPTIPIWLNALIVGPPAIALGYIGIKFARGVGG